MKFVRGALNALEILAERARDGLVHSAARVGVVWHADIDGFSPEIARFLILEARCPGVNRSHVPLCPEVPQLVRSSLTSLFLNAPLGTEGDQGNEFHTSLKDNRCATD